MAKKFSCRRHTSSFFNTLSFSTLLVSCLLLCFSALALLGVSAYALKNLQDFSSLLSESSLVYILCFAIVLLIFALLGLFGVITDNKTALIAYLVLLMVTISAQIVVSLLILNYASTFELQINTNTSSIVQEISTVAEDKHFFRSLQETELSEQEIRISDYLLRVYQTCCLRNEDFCNPDSSNPQFCERVLVCSEEGLTVDEVLCFEGSRSNLNEAIDTSVCTVFRQLGVVGDSEEEKCGSGTAGGFMSDVISLVKDNLDTLSIVALSTGVFELLLVFFTVYLIFGKDRRDKDEPAPPTPVTQHTSVGRSVGNMDPASQRRISQRLSTANPMNSSYTGSLGSPGRSSFARERTGSVDSALAGNREYRLSQRTVPIAVSNSPAKSVIRSSIPRKKIVEDKEVINDIL